MKRLGRWGMIISNTALLGKNSAVLGIVHGVSSSVVERWAAAPIAVGAVVTRGLVIHAPLPTH